MLHNELFTVSCKRLNEIKRPGKGLLMSAKAKKDQRPFQMRARA